MYSHRGAICVLTGNSICTKKAILKQKVHVTIKLNISRANVRCRVYSEYHEIILLETAAFVRERSQRKLGFYLNWFVDLLLVVSVYWWYACCENLRVACPFHWREWEGTIQILFWKWGLFLLVYVTDSLSLSHTHARAHTHTHASTRICTTLIFFTMLRHSY